MTAWICLTVIVLGVMFCASFDQWMKYRQRLEAMRLEAMYGWKGDEVSR